MTHHLPGRRLPAGVLALGSAALLVVAGTAAFILVHQGRSAQALSAPPATSSSVTAVSPQLGGTSAPASTAVIPTPQPLPPSAPLADRSSKPVRVSVPSVGIDSSLQYLGLLPDGSLQSPSQWQQAGWYDKGTVPGSVGPAVIAGHVDSVSGPAVFFRLKQITAGAVVLVRRQNGTTLKFVVDQINEYPKNQFPSAAVYGPTADAELRLITCTGDFDYSKRSYLDNLVVSAHLV